MDYEKKYKKALSRARQFSEHPLLEDSSNIVEYIFPELKESEGEKIRKDIIYFLSRNTFQFGEDIDKYKAWIAWLEKQGEQNLTDKVELKFHVGDWVVFNNKHQSIYQVEKIENGYYILRHTHGGTFRVCVLHDESLRLWTIQDAKDGDVLFHSDSASNGIFIFKELLKYDFSEKVICYCDYDSEDHFCLGEHHTCCWADAKILHPATKEQSDLLFQKMKEAGYEWDADKKELKEIDSYCQEHCKGYQETGRCFADGECQAKKDAESSWSEEDENMLKSIIATCELAEQDRDSSPARHLFEMQSNWLKSLKEKVQSQWKPSEEHISRLEDAVKYLDSIGAESSKIVLTNLLEQLKKL